MSIPREFIDLLLSKIDLVDLIHSHVPLQKKSGNNYFARCPFHNEKSASFSVSQAKQFYYCFGCGAKGNAIDFLMQHDHLRFPEAIDMLARQAGMEIPHTATMHTSSKEGAVDLYDFMAQVATYYYERMRQSPRAIAYLKERGITGKIAQQFCIGYAESGWDQLIQTFGKTEEDKKKLLDVGLIIKKEGGGYYDRFRDRILFPIHDHRGRIIGFGGRIIDQGEPKYLNSPETSLFQKGHELYGLYQALKHNRHLEHLLIVEGYMDVIALFQHEIPYAVATLGTATTNYHLKRLFRYTTSLIFCFDGDQAGKRAAWRALQGLFPLMQDNLQIRFLFLPETEDPDSLIRKEGKQAFEQRLLSALSLSAFFFQQMHATCDMNMIEGRARFASACLDYLKQLPPGLFRTILLEELSKRARIDQQSLKQQLLSSAPPPEPIPVSVTTTSPETTKIKLHPALHLVMALLVQYPHLMQTISEPLPENDLPGFAFFTQLIAIIEQHISTTGALLERWRGQKEEAFVAKLASFEHHIPEEKIENAFIKALNQVQSLIYNKKINYLLIKAAQEALTEEEKKQLSAWIAKKKVFSH